MTDTVPLLSRLELVHKSPSPQSLVIVVPGIGLPSPQKWGSPKSNWLRSFPPRSLPEPTVYSFKHNIDAEEQRSWNSVWESGGLLLEAILELKDKNKELQSCAVLFIAHSLGGIIVKEALCAAFSEWARLRPFRDSVAGVVFLGTPHSRSEEVEQWQNAQSLLTPRSVFKKAKDMESSDASKLGILCTQFETIVTEVPICSIHETEGTVLRKRLGTSSKSMLLGQADVEIGAGEEDVLPMKTHHADLCNLDTRGMLFPRLEAFVQRNISKVIQRIATHSDQYLSPPVLNESTVLTELTRNISNTTLTDLGTLSANQATLGTSQPRQDRLSQVIFQGVESSFARRNPQLPCFSVPVARNPDFFGRSDLLDTLEYHLCPPTTVPLASSLTTQSSIPSESQHRPRDLRTFAICGSGGIGKTQTATQFVHRSKNDFDAVFWLHAEEPTVLDYEFAHIAVELGLVPEASPEANNLEISRGLVKGWLAKPLKSYNDHGRTPKEEASWLIVFDNVADADALTDYWPEVGSCGSILLTSRDPLAKSNLYNVSQGENLERFDVDSASAFLLKNTWSENDLRARELAPTIVDMLGGHPLAIVQMASVMLREQLSYEDFIHRYEEEAEHAELFEQTFLSKQRQQTSSHTIASVWLLETLKSGANLLRVLSFFDPDGIEDKLLRSAIGKDGLHGYPPTTTKYQQARSELLNSALATKDASGSKLVVHRLTQDAVWAKLTDTRKPPDDAVECFNTALAVLHHAWPRAGYAERHKGDRWDKCESTLAHVFRLRKRFTRASARIQELLRSNVELADLFNEAGWYCQERARSEEANVYFHLSQSNLKSVLASNDNPRAKFLLAETHRNIGCSAAERAQPTDARFHFGEYNRLLQEEYRDRGPNDDSRLAISHFELATAHIMLRDWDKAEQRNLTALKIAGKLTDPKLAKMTRSLPQINLACMYLMTDRVEEAEPLLMNTLREREEIYGINHTVSMITGRVYHGIGWLREAQGRLDESYEYQIKALTHMKLTAGPYHHRTADMYFKVAQHLVRLHKSAEAIDYLDSASRIYGAQSCYCAEQGRTFFWKAKLLAAEDAHVEYAKALKLYRKANPTDFRPVDELTDQDFDELVTFWSR